MRTIVTKILMACVALWLAGCAGTNFKWDDARQLKKGMTQQEVTALVGKPYMVVSKGEGVQRWVWSSASMLSAKSMAVTFKDGIATDVPDIPDSF